MVGDVYSLLRNIRLVVSIFDLRSGKNICAPCWAPNIQNDPIEVNRESKKGELMYHPVISYLNHPVKYLNHLVKSC